MKKLLWALLVGTLLGGCGGEEREGAAESTKAESAHVKIDLEDHHHAGVKDKPVGLLGGQLIPLGEGEYHLELLHDAASGDLEIYIMDETAEKAVRIKQANIDLVINVNESLKKIRLEAIADPVIGSTVGDTENFIARGSLQGVRKFSGKVIELRIKGNSYKDIQLTYPKQMERLN
tara:strand:+ start:1967 stop:2494 length:528 start_codon:yes stop_codon:yes gene_type:complete